MDSQIKARWIAALRSGEYDQSESALRTEHGHCCLGVLGEVLTNAGITEWCGNNLVFGVNSDNKKLTLALQRHIGMDESMGTELIVMNDDQRKTFAEIADYIEAHL